MTKNDEALHCTTRTERLNGHQVHFEIFLPLSSTVETWNFERDYRTQCEVLPVSWNLQMKFNKMDENETILCSLVLRRTDSSSPPVKALVCIAFNGSTNPKNSSKVLQRREMRPGDEIRETVDEIVPFGDTSRSPNQNLTVHVSVFIVDCHSGQKLDLPAESARKRYSMKTFAFLVLLALICWPLVFGTEYLPAV